MDIIFTTLVDGKPYSETLPYGEKESYETIQREFMLWEMLVQHIRTEEKA